VLVGENGERSGELLGTCPTGPRSGSGLFLGPDGLVGLEENGETDEYESISMSR
jgi:hypothetical protein